MKHFFFNLFAFCCLMFFASIQVTATVFKPTSNGGLESQDISFQITAYAEGWQGLNVKGSWKDLDSESRQFRISHGDESCFTGKSSWHVVNDRIDGDIQLQCVQHISIQSLSVSLQIPLNMNKGMKWTVDDQSYVIPTGRSVNGQASKYSVSMFDDRILTIDFENPTFFIEQDLSRWTDVWSLRFGDTQKPHVYEVGDTISYHLSLTISDGISLRPFNENVVLKEGTKWVRLNNHKDVLKGSALDFTSQKLQNAPAGKYGWLQACNGCFQFQKKPGKECRFYGINLCFSACYPTHQQTDVLTDRLVRLGYNSIRIHHYDDTWDKGDPEMIDRLDYLLAQAIRKGLYITTDMYVSRSVTWESLGVDREGNVGMDLYKSLIGCFESAFQNWCQFSRRFMEHTNPYTGRMYKDEPGMPLISLVNEGELFMGFDSKKTEPIIQQAYRDFTGTDEKLEYGSKGYDAFMDYLEKQISERCSAFLRQIGCKALLTNDNNGFQHGEGESQTSLYDYVDNHFYIDHPSFLDRSWNLPSRCDNTNPVLYGGPDMFRKDYAKGFSKPYTISEWNFSGPGRYRGIGGILTGARAAIQDWDGLWRFAYAHGNNQLMDDPEQTPDYFNVATDPLSQASDRASICLFLRRDASNPDALSMDSLTGVMLLNTPRTCGIFAPDGTHSAGLLTAEISGAPGTVCISSLDGRDLLKSHRMLLSHITDVQGDGTVYADEGRKVLLHWGKGTLLERGKAQITLSLLKSKGYTVYELDTTGRRVGQIPVTETEQGITFTVSTDNSNDEGRIYYEIVR